MPCLPPSILLGCASLLVLTLSEVAPAQTSSAATRQLSSLSPQDFPTWLTGTRWEVERQGKIRTYWFVTPGFLVWTSGREGGHSIGFGYRVTGKGRVTWNFEPRREASPNQMAVAEELQSAVLDSNAEQLTMRLVERRMPPAPESVSTAAEFEKLLPELELSGVSRIVFGTDGHLTWNGARSPGRYQIVMPGVVECEWRNTLDRSLVIFSPGLDSYQAYSPDGSVTGEVTRRAAGTMAAPAAPAPAMPPAADSLRRTQSGVGALLVVSLGGSRFAGKTSQLSATATASPYGTQSTITFNQEVGGSMSTALSQVARFHEVRHGSPVSGYRIELSFEDKYSPKDGPSAAVACALLMESLITGVELDPQFSVTGDMNADGTVQPIGGVIAKLRGASKAGQHITAIPLKNRTSAVDLVVGEGIAPLLGVQLFSISTFDEALVLARKNRTPELVKALDTFASVSTTLRTNPGALQNPAIRQALNEVLAAAPNHIAARLLVAVADGRMPRQLSAPGSLEAVDQAVTEIRDATRLDVSATSSLDGGQVANVRNRLQRLRAMVDPRLHPSIDAWTTWATIADQIITRRSATPQMLQQFRAASQRIQAEARKLEGNTEFMEEVMR